MIELYFGGPVWQLCYDPMDLSDVDRARAGGRRAPRAEKDWQVSRAVAAALRRATGADRNQPVGLSHSHGHALAGLGPKSRVPGVDLERCRPRDVDALAYWICSDDERHFLDSITDPATRLEQFYVLWTLKEALVKAATLSFPAGMRQVGLAWHGTAEATVRVVEGSWQAAVWRLPDNWIAAVAWQIDADTVAQERVRWHQPGRPQELGHWRTH